MAAADRQRVKGPWLRQAALVTVLLLLLCAIVGALVLLASHREPARQAAGQLQAPQARQLDRTALQPDSRGADR